MKIEVGDNKKDILRAIIYLITFLTLAPLTLAVSFVSLLSIQNTGIVTNLSGDIEESLLEIPRFGAQVYSALPQQQSWISASAMPADARGEIVRQYLEMYNSPLLPHANILVAVADQYGLDWRLLVAIAQQESNLCKKVPQSSFNCWGWGIHSRGTLSFSDYPTAIQTVAQGIKEEYIDKGYDTVEEMMEKYTPLSNGSWATGVNQFMTELE